MEVYRVAKMGRPKLSKSEKYFDWVEVTEEEATKIKNSVQT